MGVQQPQPSLPKQRRKAAEQGWPAVRNLPSKKTAKCAVFALAVLCTANPSLCVGSIEHSAF
jgi:hypothetical protein